jgi:hypothetical protein
MRAALKCFPFLYALTVLGKRNWAIVVFTGKLKLDCSQRFSARGMEPKSATLARDAIEIN